MQAKWSAAEDLERGHKRGTSDAPPPVPWRRVAKRLTITIVFVLAIALLVGAVIATLILIMGGDDESGGRRLLQRSSAAPLEHGLLLDPSMVVRRDAPASILQHDVAPELRESAST